MSRLKNVENAIECVENFNLSYALALDFQRKSLLLTFPSLLGYLDTWSQSGMICIQTDLSMLSALSLLKIISHGAHGVHGEIRSKKILLTFPSLLSIGY